MAPRKPKEDTQGAEKTAQAADAPNPAPVHEPPGSAGAGDAVPPSDPAPAPVAPPDDGPVKPDDAPDEDLVAFPAAPERRFATVASPIRHNGELYAVDDLIRLTEAEAEPLFPTGALVERSWNACDPD